MTLQTYASYRGYNVNVQVTQARTLSFHGVGRRYKVSWVIGKSGHSGRAIASFPERLEFIAEHEAFRYAENRAHTFIDCMLSGKHGMPPSAEVLRNDQPLLEPEG